MDLHYTAHYATAVRAMSTLFRCRTIQTKISNPHVGRRIHELTTSNRTKFREKRTKSLVATPVLYALAREAAFASAVFRALCRTATSTVRVAALAYTLSENSKNLEFVL